MSTITVSAPSQIVVTASTGSTYSIVATSPSAVTITVSPSGAIGLTGPTGPTGATGESGINRVYYGTGSAPSAVGEADGALFFKYT